MRVLGINAIFHDPAATLVIDGRIDTVRGILDLAQSDHPGPMNIGSPYEISMLDLAKLIIELTGSRAEIRFVERLTDDPGVRRPDTTLARAELGWEPRIPIEEGLKATAEWFGRELLLARSA
jgi:dTDP-glucose 4,6-dehydratase